ncbi:hypothetical protein GMLC_33760 [Geomonas limicola]|uniref:Uncharacterized protein n=1 Tax=Geomonas limicola TaxID=2740186 RepID=A0A6V8NDB7_9BACT|nr:hypothetical protein [Geomonas limicola]GFO69797.1 hypothetical protein GMLC_33760 [Geomonas limicola]
MNKLMAIVASLVFVVTAAVAFAQGNAESPFKAGASIYACGCGAGCPCGTISAKAGKCGCGKNLVKTTVTKVADNKVYYQMNGAEVSAPATGKYVCSCGCPCNTVSQKEGTCACGKPLKKAE